MDFYDYMVFIILLICISPILINTLLYRVTNLKSNSVFSMTTEETFRIYYSPNISRFGYAILVIVVIIPTMMTICFYGWTAIKLWLGITESVFLLLSVYLILLPLCYELNVEANQIVTKHVIYGIKVWNIEEISSMKLKFVNNCDKLILTSRQYPRQEIVIYSYMINIDLLIELLEKRGLILEYSDGDTNQPE